MRRLLLKLFRRRRLEQDLEAELAFHREMAAAHGNPIPLGNSSLFKEQARDLWRFTFVENLWRDLLYGARGLRRSPALVVSALLSLGLGIGANTAIFSLVTEFLLSEPSVADPRSWMSLRVGGRSHSRPEVVEAFQTSGAFESVVGEREESSLNWDNGTDTRPLYSVETTSNYFTALGVPLALGRGYTEADPKEVVVLSHRFWRERLGGDPNILGRLLRLDGRAYTVVGVLPQRHRTLIGFGFSPDVYVPRLRPDTELAIYARLPPGATPAEAQARALAVAQRLDRERPDRWRHAHNLRATPLAGPARLRSQNAAAMVLFSAVLLTVVALVLLIACVNVASLLLARAAARRQEIGIRLSLGASRGRLLQQLLAESLLLSLLGLGSGLLIRHAVSLGLEQVRLPLPVPIRLQLELNWRVTAYAAALMLFASFATGLLPAWQAVRESLATAVRREGRLRLRRGLVVAQVALSFVVLATSFLFLRNLWQSSSLSPGFDIRRTLRADVHLPPAAYPSPERKRAFIQEAVQTLASLPGVESAAAARILPFTDGVQNMTGVAFTDTGEKVESRYHWNAVTPGYFRTMDVSILQGGTFSAVGEEGAVPVIVNRTWVERFAPGRPAVGRTFRLDGNPALHLIVGVAEGTKVMTIGEDPQPQLYESLARAKHERTRFQFVVRSAVPPAIQLDAVRTALRRIEPGAGLEVETLSSSVGLAFLPSQVGAVLLGTLGLLALVLAAVGLYGVMAYAVVRRTREIGVRMAIGAGRRDIARLVVGEAAWLVGLGGAIGLVAALLVTQPLAAFLVPGLQPRDPVSLAGVLFALAAAGLVAVGGPLRRAVAVDPSTSLRYE